MKLRKEVKIFSALTLATLILATFFYYSSSTDYEEYFPKSLENNVVGFWPLNSSEDDLVKDYSKNENFGIFSGDTHIEENSADFDGEEDMIVFPFNPDYSISTHSKNSSHTGEIAISHWINFHDFNFTNKNRHCYVNYGGVGDGYWPEKNQEWGFRIYDQCHNESPGLLCFYVFNLEGELGIGSCSQIEEDHWYNILGGTDGENVYLYINGELRDYDPLIGKEIQGEVINITPESGNSTMHWGWRDHGSGYMKGRMRYLSILDTFPSEEEIQQIYEIQRNTTTG